MGTKESLFTDGVNVRATDQITGIRSGANVRFPVACLVAQAKTAIDVDYVAGDTRIDLATVVFDPSSTITTGGSWHWTCPATGYYMFVADEFESDAKASNWAVGEVLKTYLYKSTSTYLAQLGYRAFDVATTFANQSDAFLNGVGFASLTAADQCHVDYRNLTAHTRTLFAGARLSILRVA